MLRTSFLAWAATTFMTAAAPQAAGAAEATATDQAPVAPSIEERGKYLATAGNCISCHTRPGGVAFTGGRPFSTPFGTLYSTNITPDNETGIGTWKAEDMRRAMHEGVAPEGRRLFPAFPYTSFTKVTDADVDAIYAYLRSLQPVRYTPPDNGILFWQRWPMRLWNAFFFEPARFVPNPSQTDEWNRGAYLVGGLGHCSACHTPRNKFMAEIGDRAYAGGSGLMEEVATDQLRPWSGANLTSAREGLAAWSVGDLTKYLKTGFSPRAGTFGPMNDVILNSTKEMTAEDVRAMAVYIKSLPAHASATPTVTADQAKAGEAIYEARCEKCHMSSGRGGMFTAPPLSGSAVVQTDDPASLINIVLFGPTVPKEVKLGAWETMKGYHESLNDEDVAKLANYLRGSWGNRGRAVTPADVARQRGPAK